MSAPSEELFEGTLDADSVQVEVAEFAREESVGITEFLNPDFLGFSGIIKHRFTDFKVHEVGLDGETVRLTQRLMDPELEKLVNETEGANRNKLCIEMVDGVHIKEALQGVISDDAFFERLSEFYNRFAHPKADEDTTNANELFLVTPVLPDKPARTLVHQAVRTLFKGVLQTQAQDDDCIRIYHFRQTTAAAGRDNRNRRPADQCNFLSFHLYKENMDTMEAVQTLARRLHMNAKDFSYAGTKDRRGITVQRIVARNVTPKKILGINKLAPGENKQLAVSDIQGPLCLGDLKGNRFELILRDLSGATNEEIVRELEFFQSRGFLNYFGLQRFGQSSVSSHAIGIALLRNDWQGAIALILDPRESEPDQRAAAARKHWKETGDAMAAKMLFPSRYTAERQILDQYSRDNNDHLGAILSINRELRLMYVHSVQSLVWNRMASVRHQSFGQGLVTGDLVMTDDGVQLVTESNLSTFTAENLALPLPGHASQFPDNQMGQEYRRMLEEVLQVPFLDLKSLFKPKQKALWDLPGAYRPVYALPSDFKYQLGTYDDPDELLDAALLERNHSSGEGKHRGLFVGFSLPTSSYATMALRELMHTDTDPTQHKLKTKRHRTQ